VLGPDYFFSDPVHKHTEPDFDRKAWVDKTKQRADEIVPGWIEAVKEKYGNYYGVFHLLIACAECRAVLGTDNTTYTAVGE
jgi:hypothetical protein